MFRLPGRRWRRRMGSEGSGDMNRLKLRGARTLSGCLLVLGCGTHDPSDDVGGGDDPLTPEPRCTADERPVCLDDLGDGTCSDVGQLAVCDTDSWRCPSGTVEQSRCICPGPPPATGCSCAADGWRCPGTCHPAEAPVCLLDRGHGECSDTSSPATCDGGSWRCPGGTLPLTSCVCAGPPPDVGCNCEPEGWVCGATL